MKKEGSKRLEVDYAGAVSEFANTIQKFPLKLILYRTIFRGKGLEFDTYRNFEPDDDASLIDWKASLRSNNIVVRKYIEERDLKVYLIVDCSGSVLFGSENKLKAEFNAELAVALSYLVLEGEDKVGLIMLNDDVVKFIEAKKGKKQFELIQEVLKDTKHYQGSFNLKKAIDRVLDTIKSEYTIFIIISDFLDLKKDVTRKMKFLGNKFETIAIMSRDKLDNAIPNFGQQVALTDPTSGKTLIIDPKSVDKMYKKIVDTHKKRLKQVFLDSNIDLLELNINEPFFLPVSQFLRSRSRGERI